MKPCRTNRNKPKSNTKDELRHNVSPVPPSPSHAVPTGQPCLPLHLKQRRTLLRPSRFLRFLPRSLFPPDRAQRRRKLHALVVSEVFSEVFVRLWLHGFSLWLSRREPEWFDTGKSGHVIISICLYLSPWGNICSGRAMLMFTSLVEHRLVPAKLSTAYQWRLRTSLLRRAGEGSHRIRRRGRCWGHFAMRKRSTAPDRAKKKAFILQCEVPPDRMTRPPSLDSTWHVTH